MGLFVHGHTSHHETRGVGIPKIIQSDLQLLARDHASFVGGQPAFKGMAFREGVLAKADHFVF